MPNAVRYAQLSSGFSYRSVIFYASDEQKRAAEDTITDVGLRAVAGSHSPQLAALGSLSYKRSREIDEIRLRPHPYEFFLYYDI